MVAVKLAVCFLSDLGYRNTQVIIHSDNQGVIDALYSSYSHSIQQNHVFRCIIELFVAFGI